MKPKSGVTVLGPAPTPKSPVVHNAKWHGQIAELAFLHKVTKMGFAVTKPYGDNESYDFIVDAGNCLWRVQVKSSSRRKNKAYYLAAVHFRNAQKTRWAYTPEQIDVLAVIIVPEDAWYIIPVCAFTPHTSLTFGPHIPGSSGKYERFREAWFLMTCRRNGEPRDGIITSPPCSYSASSGSSCPSCPYRNK